MAEEGENKRLIADSRRTMMITLQLDPVMHVILLFYFFSFISAPGIILYFDLKVLTQL